MVAEVALAYSRRARDVYAEESVRTLFVLWAGSEMRDARRLRGLLGNGKDPDPGSPAGRDVPGKVREAARRAQDRPAPPAPAAPPETEEQRRWRERTAKRYRPRPGGEVRGNTLVIDIDDPGALSAYRGTHGALRSMVPRGGKGR
jgi:hypothetical protein